MKKNIIFIILIFIFVQCKNKNSVPQNSVENQVQENSVTEVIEEVPPSYLLKYKGIGAIKNISLNENIDLQMAEKGEGHFRTFCMSCHKPTKKFIGSAPKDILKRRSPEWVMNMILNPVEMQQKDSLAMEMLKKSNNFPMPKQNVSETQAREILEYFRTIK